MHNRAAYRSAPLAACAIALCAPAASAQVSSTDPYFHTEINMKDSARVSAEAILNRADTTATPRGTASFTCPAGASQQDLVNGPAFVGFAYCGVFNPIDNLIPATNSTFNTMCIRGDYRVSFSSFPADICTGIGIDADALVGWTFKLFEVDSIGMPTGTPIYTASTDPPLSNLAMQRFQFGETYDNTPGGRPIETWHLTLSGAPTMQANTCYWFGICWDPAVNANPNLADCTFRWAAGIGGDGFVLFDNNPADDVYGFCSHLPGDFDWTIDFPVIIPDPFGIPCLDASLAAPPTNQTCATPLPLDSACGPTPGELRFCPVVASPNADSMNNPPVSCLEPGATTDYLFFPTWYTIQPTNTKMTIEMCQGYNDGWDAAFAIYRESDHADICAELAAAGQTETLPLTEFACSDNGIHCGNDPSLCLAGLTPGETLYILVGGTDGQNIGEIHFTIDCENDPSPINDECENALHVGYNFLGEWDTSSVNTTCAEIDHQAAACGGTTNGISPGVWYHLDGDGNAHTASACFLINQYDTQLNAYRGDCGTGLTCIAGDDNGVCAPQSEIQFCTEVGHDYYVLLHGFHDSGVVDINFTRGPACTPACEGDANGDSTVDVNDISYVLFRLGNPGPDGDANNDGTVDVNDISYVLFRLGNTCP